MNILDILMCPECKSILSEDLNCKGCNNQYIAQNNGVFNLISQKLSGALLQEQKEISELLANRRKNSEPVTESEEYEQAWQQMRQKMNDFINPLLNELSGTVCDLATGVGSHLRRLLNAEPKDFNIVCIDIERTALMLAAQQKDHRIFCVAGDARYMPVKDNSFDYITSHGVFCEVGEIDTVAKEMYRTLKPHGKLLIRGEYIDKNDRKSYELAESDKVAKEIYRTLKPHGKLLIRGEYINKHDSQSYELARTMKLEKGIVEENLIQELENAGFKNIVSTIVAELKREIPEGILPPVAGGMMYFYVIQAEKL